MQLHALPIVLELAHERSIAHRRVHGVERARDAPEHRRHGHAHGQVQAGEVAGTQRIDHPLPVGVPRIGALRKRLGVGGSHARKRRVVQHVRPHKRRKHRRAHRVDAQVRTQRAHHEPPLLAAAGQQQAAHEALLLAHGPRTGGARDRPQRRVHLADGERLMLHELRHATARHERDVARVAILRPGAPEKRCRTARHLHRRFLQQRTADAELDAGVRRGDFVAQ